jgi:RNA polymerase sigma factor (sigma-70 family)
MTTMSLRSTPSDADLIQSYTTSRSYDAYQALVERYTPFVNAICRRSLGAGHPWLDDACQAVFLILEKKASSIRSGHALPRWLHRTAMGVCSQVRRQEARRKQRESVAQAQSATSDQPAASDMTPLLDEAVASLRRRQREVVLTYYLAGKSQADVAQQLGISESAVKMRSHAAVEQLRSFFKRRGVVVPTASLLALFARESAAASTPVAAASGVGGATTTATAIGLAQGTVRAILNAKLLFATCIVLAVIAPVIAIMAMQKFANKSPAASEKSVVDVSAELIGTWSIDGDATWESFSPDISKLTASELVEYEQIRRASWANLSIEITSDKIIAHHDSGEDVAPYQVRGINGGVATIELTTTTGSRMNCTAELTGSTLRMTFEEPAMTLVLKKVAEPVKNQ